MILERIGNFGKYWIHGRNNFLPDLPIDEQLEILGLLNSCPNPKLVSELFGKDWTIKRYTECNLVGGFILEKAEELNPPLARMLQLSIARPDDEHPIHYDPAAVPHDYYAIVHPGSTPCGYAASRVLIEQFGRPDWEIGSERVKRGVSALEKALLVSRTPPEFLATLAKFVTETDAPKDAVLSHIFAVEFEDEGVLFLAGQVYDSLKHIAPDLWKHYMRLSDDEKRSAGITTHNFELNVI